MVNELQRMWAPRVRAYLAQHGDSVPYVSLGGAAQIPPHLRGKVTFGAALSHCGFESDGTHVTLPNAHRGRGRAAASGRAPGTRGRSPAPRAPGARSVVITTSSQARRRGREDESVEHEQPARRRQRTRAGSASMDPLPAHAMPDDADEEQLRRYGRSFRFGTPIPGAGGASLLDGAPSHPAAPFDWSRYAHSWRSFDGDEDEGQRRYQQLLASTAVTVVVGLGVAGTGKTLLAVQEGLHRLREGRVRKLILGRPAVTADEDLGFLPGSEKDKITPLLAPMLDAIDKIMGPGAWAALQRAHLLEMQSFAYMRGRNHDDAFVIADEVQNASLGQLKLLTTRLGHGSKLCILGDGSQPDRHVGANWAAGPRGTTSSIELLAHFIDADGFSRAGVPADAAASFAVAHLTRCFRSETAAAAVKAFEQLERENVPPRGRGGPSSAHGSAAALLSMAVAQAQRESS